MEVRCFIDSCYEHGLFSKRALKIVLLGLQKIFRGVGFFDLDLKASVFKCDRGSPEHLDFLIQVQCRES
jgi:hypothetical protein